MLLQPAGLRQVTLLVRMPSRVKGQAEKVPGQLGLVSASLRPGGIRPTQGERSSPASPAQLPLCRGNPDDGLRAEAAAGRLHHHRRAGPLHACPGPIRAPPHPAIGRRSGSDDIDHRWPVFAVVSAIAALCGRDTSACTRFRPAVRVDFTACAAPASRGIRGGARNPRGTNHALCCSPSWRRRPSRHASACSSDRLQVPRRCRSG